jgi:tetratricopeptide (TPR) repeat protein
MGTMKCAAALLLGGLLLAGCSRPAVAPSPAAATPVSPAAMVNAIRAIARQDKSVIRVTPLRDPSVEGYLTRAHVAEGATRFQEALDDINAALRISPDSPDILQFRAEEHLLLRNFPAAAADAQRSYQIGPKVGGLCASNWQTLVEIAQSEANALAVTTAKMGLAGCTEPPQPSF